MIKSKIATFQETIFKIYYLEILSVSEDNVCIFILASILSKQW